MAFTWSELTVTTSGGADVRDWIWDSGHSQLIAVGGSGLVYTTPDLVTVTKRTASEANNWRGLAFAPALGVAGRVVAVASNGTHRVMYSDDGGATWTNATAASALSWQAVTWAASLALFVAVASTGAANGSDQVMTSPDGIAWTTRAALNPRQAWSGVTWSSSLSLLVAVSASTASVGGVVMTSTNGTAWTVRTTPANQYGAGGAACGSNFVQWDSVSGLFAFCSLNNVGAADRFVTTSPDGTNWTKQTLPNPSDASGGLIGVTGVGLVLFRENSGNDNVNTSANGSTWATENTGFNGTFDCAGKINSLGKVCSWAQANTIVLVGAPAPSTVTSVAPSSGTTAGGLAVTITGTNFSGTPVVTFGGSAATSIVVVNSATITCVTPAHAVGAVTVAVDAGSLASAFTYVPVLTSISPIFGTKRGGTVVTVTGSGFTGVTGLTFGGTAAVSVIVSSDTEIVCVTAPHAGALVDVLVAGATLANAYTYVAVDRVSPRTGTVMGGTAVTITGYGFTMTTGVLFDADAATNVVLDPTTPNLKLSAVTPAHDSGVVDVTVSGVDVGANLYTYTLPVPQLQGKGALLPPIPPPSRT